MRYQIKTDIFRYFDYDEIIYPHNGGMQYGKEFALPGDNCFYVDFIISNPTYFVPVSGELPKHNERLLTLAEDIKTLKRLRMID